LASRLFHKASPIPVSISVAKPGVCENKYGSAVKHGDPNSGLGQHCQFQRCHRASSGWSYTTWWIHPSCQSYTSRQLLCWNLYIVRMTPILIYATNILHRIFFTQLIGSPLYFVNKEWYYTYMSLTKQSFGLLVITISDWWSPTKIRISGDESVRGQIRLDKEGLLECDFPERIVLIANHQVLHTLPYLSL